MKVLHTIPGMPASWYFPTREDAGRHLAQELAREHAGADAVVLAIPRGGVPVGVPIALTLDAPLDVIIPRKLPIPWDPEAGFGAVTADGTVVLNEEMASLLQLSSEELQRAVSAVQAEIRRRSEVYRGRRPPQDVAGKLVVLTDDGLASGYTMIAAIRSVRTHHPAGILVAIPVAPRDSLRRVAPEADDLLCLVEQMAGPFAVASYYRQFPELSDEEVLRDLQRAERLAAPS